MRSDATQHLANLAIFHPLGLDLDDDGAVVTITEQPEHDEMLYRMALGALSDRDIDALLVGVREFEGRLTAEHQRRQRRPEGEPLPAHPTDEASAWPANQAGRFSIDPPPPSHPAYAALMEPDPITYPPRPITDWIALGVSVLILIACITVLLTG